MYIYYMKNFISNIFKSKPKHNIPEYIVLNVDNFNLWFCNQNNPDIYANKGIYLRIDKLSINHITIYIKECYNIDIESTNINEYDLYSVIIKNWNKQLNEKI